MGVAWPSMAEDLARDLGDLGILTAVMGGSYAVVSLASGSVTKRIPAGKLLVAAATAAGISLAVYAGADGFVWFVLASIPLGMAGGAIDANGRTGL